MDDYISREAAINDVKNLDDTMFVCVSMDECNGMRSMKKRALTALERIPAADVRPVKEGYWQEGEFKYLTCSVCGCDTNLYDQHGFPIGQRKGHPYPCFCPHCGADMTGGADG